MQILRNLEHMDWFGSIDLNEPTVEDFHPGVRSNETNGQVDGPYTATGTRHGAYASNAGPLAGDGSGAGPSARPSLVMALVKVLRLVMALVQVLRLVLRLVMALLQVLRLVMALVQVLRLDRPHVLKQHYLVEVQLEFRPLDGLLVQLCRRASPYQVRTLGAMARFNLHRKVLLQEFLSLG